MAQVVRGYPLCPALAITLVILAAVASSASSTTGRSAGSTPTSRSSSIPAGTSASSPTWSGRWTTPGWRWTAGRRPLPLAVPGRLLGRIAGPAIRALVPDRPVDLVGHDLEIGLYPSDISIGGKRAVVARARAAIATRLTSTAASMTTSAEAQEVEAILEGLTAEPGRRRRAGRAARGGRPGDSAGDVLAEVDRRLAELDVPHDEWEILYRQRLQVERDLLAGRAPGQRPRHDRRLSPLGIVPRSHGSAAAPAGLVRPSIAAAGLRLTRRTGFALLDRPTSARR